METFYLVLVILLFFLAISDLIVGVSNDAVNFLNSAVGSKAASFRVIMIVATIGILVGATFSSGMMEVARKGIFHPQLFYFSEIILLFLAVMITDVILLDLFNTYGMPTSTTVSIVFELLGAAVAISIIKIMSDPNALPLGEYINSAKALAIISGILLSVVVAFSVGAIVQYLTRMLFSFDYKKRLKYFGAIFGGLAISAITYFILIKGVKGTSFMTDDAKNIVQDNAFMIISMTFLGSAILMQIITMLTRFNIMQFIVLVGTFALAMAFAGNDLVNFIGVPLAGYESFKAFVANPGVDPNALLMADLTGKVKTPTFFLLLAGAVMVATLWLSKKAKSVVKTSLDLGRQDEGYERFAPNQLSRSIVRSFSNGNSFINRFTPQSVKSFAERQFDQTAFIQQQHQHRDNTPSFDMVRASVTLVVASILISIGTSLKLPLSTTYVTFMVAMGASLADGAWGRESAVYRVSGVVSVVGGWFFTAFSAFTVAFIIAFIISYGQIVGIVLMLGVAVSLVIRTHRIHHRMVEEQEMMNKSFEGVLTRNNAIELGAKHVKEVFSKLSGLQMNMIRGLEVEDLNLLNKTNKEYKKLNKKVLNLKNNYNKLIDKIEDDDLEYGYYYIIVIDYLIEITSCFGNIIFPAFSHVDNNHKPLLPDQIEDFLIINTELNNQFDALINIFDTRDREKAKLLLDSHAEYLKLVKVIRKRQIKRIKAHEVGTRNSNLFFNILGEYRDLGLFCNSLVKTCDNLINYFTEDSHLRSAENTVDQDPPTIINGKDKKGGTIFNVDPGAPDLPKSDD